LAAECLLIFSPIRFALHRAPDRRVGIAGGVIPDLFCVGKFYNAAGQIL
jgi:hypothetical protein